MGSSSEDTRHRTKRGQKRIENTLKIDYNLITAHMEKFEEMLSANGSGLTINMSDVNLKTMEKVLELFYFGKFKFDAKDVNDLFDLARKFKIPVLKKYLLNHIEEINIDNFLAFYIASKEENMENKMKFALDFFAE
jgi:hypothetical protein